MSRIFGASPLASRAELGIGDDAAVLAPPPGRRLVVSVDEQVEGTHFRRDLVTYSDIGYRATMAARRRSRCHGGRAARCGGRAGRPGRRRRRRARGSSTAAAAARVGFPVVGGNLARGSALSIATTVLGLADVPLLRAGARPGDGVFVSGALGLAHLGFVAMSRGVRDEVMASARAAWTRPDARIADGLRVRGWAHAAIDVSDGLAKDAGAIADASGVTIVLERALLAAHAEASGAAAAARALGADVEDAMLRGGEDYALVVTAPEGEPIAGFARIGTVRVGPSVVVLRDAVRGEVEVTGGFDHFAPRAAPR
ncbi:MAG: thiamine-phosphate kinase [Polyangiaceae bacterium]